MRLSLHSLWEVFHNHAIICSLIGWFVAQSLKIPMYYLVEKKWDFRRFVGSGGMPSSHSAMVISLAIMVGGIKGFDTVDFAGCFVLAMIVMYDAAGVRRATGTQATVINQILKDFLLNGKQISDEELKELVGHTPLEVAAGALLGLIISGTYLAILAG